MTTANQIIAVAKGEIGVTEYPPNSNKVKYWDAYSPYWNGEPWCDRFVSWCGWRAGAADIVGVFDYCPYHVNFFKGRGQWISRTGTPQPGDIVFFANKGVACHVGIVVSRNGAESITTIEGNTSSTNNANGGRVEQRTRTYGSVGSSWYILGFGRPPYDKEDDMPLTKDDIAHIWEYKYGNDSENCYNKLTKAYQAANETLRTDDPTGRGVEMTDHDHIKWMAQAQQETLAAIKETNLLLKQLLTKS